MAGLKLEPEFISVWGRLKNVSLQPSVRLSIGVSDTFAFKVLDLELDIFIKFLSVFG